MFAGRGKANLMTRVTAGLAAAFFTTSLLLTIVGTRTAPQGSLLDAPAATAPAAPATTDGAAPATAPAEGAPRGGILDKIQ